MKTLKPKEPKLVSLLLTLTSGLSLGLLLGVYVTLTKPVTVAAKMPDAAVLAKPGDYTTYHVSGRASTVETQNLKSGISRIQRRSPGPVSFSEDELNYYLNQFAKQSKEATKNSEEVPASEVSALNVRIRGDEMFASMKLVMDPKGNRFEMVVQAQISFENSDEGPEVKVSNLRINSLPVPDFGGVVGSVVVSKFSEIEWPEDYVEMWSNIRKIELESDKIITEVGLKRA